jgi:hypothetical protein
MSKFSVIVDQLEDEHVEFAGTLVEFANARLKEYAEANGYDVIVVSEKDVVDGKIDVMKDAGMVFEQEVKAGIYSVEFSDNCEVLVRKVDEVWPTDPSLVYVKKELNGHTMEMVETYGSDEQSISLVRIDEDLAVETAAKLTMECIEETAPDYGMDCSKYVRKAWKNLGEWIHMVE